MILMFTTNKQTNFLNSSDCLRLAEIWGVSHSDRGIRLSVSKLQACQENGIGKFCLKLMRNSKFLLHPNCLDVFWA